MNTEFKGTQGNWEFKDETEKFDPAIISGKTVVCYGNFLNKERKANAQLIAAAPELLKALLEVKEILEKAWRKQEWDEFANKETSFTKAINKALGNNK